MIRSSGHSLIGIDVGQRSVAAVQLDGAGAISAAAVLARKPSKPDAPFSAEEAGALEEVLYRQGFTGRSLAVGVPDHLLVTEVLELPPRTSGAPIDHLARMEVCRVHKREPESMELACWDLPAPSRAGESTHVMAAACAHADADALMDAIEGSGFVVCTLDARAWALARACRPVTDASQLAAILDIGEHAALLAFVHGGVPVYQRPMRDSGLARLRTRIHETLSLAPDVADYLLDTVARSDPKSSTATDDGAARQAAVLIDEHIDALAAEVRTAFDYTTRRYPAALGQMSVVGPGAVFSRLGERLSAALGVVARAVTPADLAPCARPLADLCRDPAMTAALGLAQWGRAAA